MSEADKATQDQKDQNRGWFIFIVITLICIAACYFIFRYKSGNSNDNPASNVTSTEMTKYTRAEITDYITSARQAMEFAGSSPNLSDIASCESAMTSLGIYWSAARGSLIEARVDSTVFPLNTMDSAVKALEAYGRNNYPRFREVYVKNASSILWEHDIEAFCSGKKNDEITLVGGFFVKNANKKAVYEQLLESLKKYRFKKVVFKWYEGDDNPTYFDITSENDKDWYFNSP